MCEGNNHTIQDYLRTQPDNIRNINLVQMVASTLGILVADMSTEMAPLINQCCITITEFIQGNRLNQRDVFDARIIDQINTIIRHNASLELEDRIRMMRPVRGKPAAEIETAEMTVAMDTVSIDLMHRLLETNDGETAYIAKECDKILDVTRILYMMYVHACVTMVYIINILLINSPPIFPISYLPFDVRARLCHQIFPILLPHFRLYEVVLIHMCVLPIQIP